MALTTSLQGYWKFDESSGNAADSSGNGNTLTNNGTMPYGAGKINNAAQVNFATPKYPSIADGSQTGLDITGDQSHSFWIYIPSFSTSVYHTFSLLQKWTESTSRQYSAYLVWLKDADPNPDKWDFHFANSSNGSNVADITLGHIAGATLPRDQWNHVVYIFTASTGTFEVYVNGTSVGTASGLFTSTNNGTGPFSVGYGPYGTTDTLAYFDETGIWSRVLTSGEVATLYNAGAGLSYPFSTVNAGASFLAFM